MKFWQRKLRQARLLRIKQIDPLNIMLLALKRCWFLVNVLILKPDTIVAVKRILFVYPVKNHYTLI